MEQTTEQAKAALEAAEAGNIPNEEGGQVEATEPESPAQPSTGIDEAKFKAMFEEMLKQSLNPIQSELGQLRKVRSEFSKLQQNNNQVQSPKSWEELDPQTRQSTKELIQHLLEKELGYSERFQKYDSMIEKQEKAERQSYTLDVVRDYVGTDFDNLDPIMGKLLREVQGAAKSGNESAQRFLWEFENTDSGIYRLADIAKAEYAKSLEGKSAQAKNEQAERAKKASTAVGGAKPAPASTGADGGPTDPKEWMAWAKEQLMKADQ